MSSADVTAVVVSYNTRDLLLDCLRALALERVGSVVVVDNDSSDGSADLVDSEFPDIVLVRNQENVGFARAVNQALVDVSSKYVLLLNPDTSVAPGALAKLRAVMEADGQVAAVGPSIHHPDGRARVLSAGCQPSLWRVFAHYSGLSRMSGFSPVLNGWQHRIGIHDQNPIEVGWLSGACLLCRTEAVRGIGYLSERWFMYAEDLELCARLTDSGWRLVHLPSVLVYHLVGASSSSSPSVSTAWVDSLKDYYRYRWQPARVTDLAWRVTLAGGLGARSVAYFIQSARSPDTRRMWRFEARKFAAYSRAAIHR